MTSNWVRSGDTVRCRSRIGLSGDKNGGSARDKEGETAHVERSIGGQDKREEERDEVQLVVAGADLKVS